MTSRLPVSVLACLGLLSCGGESPPEGVDSAGGPRDGGSSAVGGEDGEQEPKGSETVPAPADDDEKQRNWRARYGFEVWHDDFPYAIELSPPTPGRWYDKSRRGILESVAANLSGQCSRRAWILAKDFFRNAEAEDASVLITTFDRALQRGQLDLAETVIAAMGVHGGELFVPAILRALDWKRQALQNTAASALARCGTKEAIEASRKSLLGWPPSVQVRWLEAVVEILEPAEAAEYVRDALRVPQLGFLLKEFVRIAIDLPPEHAVRALEPILQTPPPGLEDTFLGLRHATGDGAATQEIGEMLSSDSPMTRALALRTLRIGRGEHFLDRVLELSNDPSPEVRAAVVELLHGLGDDDRVVAALETLAIDDNLFVRQNALRTLVQLDRTDVLDDLLEELGTATGSRFQLRLADAVAAGDPRAVEVIAQRMQHFEPADRRPYMSRIAQMRRPEALPFLREVFLGPRFNFGGGDGGPQLESDAYAALLMGNLTGAEWEILTMFGTLDRADYRRRALLLSTVAAVARDRNDPELTEATDEMLRGLVFDMEEIPQMRLYAMELLSRSLTVADVQALARQTRKESRAMKEAWTAHLFEYF